MNEKKAADGNKKRLMKSTSEALMQVAQRLWGFGITHVNGGAHWYSDNTRRI